MNTRGSSRSEPLLKIIAGQDMTEAMRLIRDIGQYEHSVYHLAHRPNSPTDLPYFKSTYPHSWLGRYIENEYFNIDPAIVRLLFVLMAVMGGHGLLIYLILWLVMPEVDEPVKSAAA